MPKDAFPALRPNQQSQRKVHDFPLGLKPRQLARLTHQTFINLNIRSAHIESMHHFRRLWCVFHSSTVFTSTFSCRSKIPTLSGPLTSFSTDFHNSFESHPSRKPFPSANLNPTVSNSDAHSNNNIVILKSVTFCGTMSFASSCPFSTPIQRSAAVRAAQSPHYNITSFSSC